jgi:hypothetical protein
MQQVRNRKECAQSAKEYVWENTTKILPNDEKIELSPKTKDRAEYLVWPPLFLITIGIIARDCWFLSEA